MSSQEDNIFLSNSTTDNSFEDNYSLFLSIKYNRFSSNPKDDNNTNCDYISIIYRLIEEIIKDNENNDDKKINKSNNSLFHMKNLPNIPLFDYFLRIHQYLNPEKSTIILSLIYVDNFYTDSNTNTYINYNNIYKVFLIATVLAIKYNEDDYDNNEIFAKVGGIPLDELNKLEIEFCKLLEFNFYVNSKTFEDYKIFLENF